MYYQDGITMEAIADRTGQSRSTISRLLRDARAHGLVTITLRPPGQQRVQALQVRLRDRFGVSATVVPVAPTMDERERLDAAAQEAAALIDSLMDTSTVMGIAWGTTMTAVADAIRPRPVPGARIVQLNGAIDSEGAGFDYATAAISRLAQKWDAQMHPFAVPAFFDYEDTRRAMWRERSTRRILDLQNRTSIAAFGAGAFDSAVPSHVYASGYFTKEVTEQLQADGVVGDVCTIALRADGSWRDIELNRRATGPDPDRLKRIPRRILVGAGSSKARALRAALLAGVATDLVVDESAAAGILAD
ncbi:MarR family transcriptional regulator [Helcobacillus massiliensis]|uniref:sugar-binding transcriptional regulator n=1 Tax=Helcobacillus TaxID=1161125 RepID=UPI001EF6B97E|nr:MULTISPECIES: sugar-binding domain-containing protein [Helcobacillus]MCG7427600.1 MarR family transcriptional regulator [Helcobacillus sp. ACRRO]MCT1558686.1 MarR family transcriptional regulator [Helcobacillus massiliensis]MCT2037278.1 MarR family transcriptional regulator [Helcobacillus massiliensis]MCT2332908.1 MarR family transcriptional regulator [Helcobacillus massiliensis]MDK7743038.1 sugar-binding domain-containing protein [Helcobacillus massiliensis]